MSRDERVAGPPSAPDGPWALRPPGATPADARQDGTAGRVLAVDLGSARTRVWLSGRGLLADLPSTAPGGERPVWRGQIRDAAAGARLLRRVLEKHTRCTPASVTVLSRPVLSARCHRRAMEQALAAAAGHRVLLVDSARAAAAASCMPGAGDRPLVVVDVGAGLVEVTLLTGGKVADARQAELGLNDLADGMPPARIARTVHDLVSAMHREDQTAAVDGALQRGVLLTGGGALHSEIPRSIARSLDSPARTALAPATATVRGVAAYAASVQRRTAGPAHRAPATGFHG